MKSLVRKHIILSCLAAIVALMAGTTAAEPITVSVDTSKPGAEISPRMAGLSYETSLMLPDANGVHYFRPDNKPLIQLFKTLGVKVLRIGGNSVDSPKIRVPAETDVRTFFEFARAAGVKVIYSVRLEESTDSGALPPSTAESNATAAATVARLIRDQYADVLDSFSIGNEPYYFKKYGVYSSKWAAIRDAIFAVYPKATFCGPDQNPTKDLCKRMVKDFGNETGRLVQITQHSYPFGCSYRNPTAQGPKENAGNLIPQDAASSRAKMLAPDAYHSYEGIYKGMASAVAGTALTYRLSETNSYWFSGLRGASDSYASALWASDYLLWWANHGADGLNFHTGDQTGGTVSLPCRYAAFVTSANGYEARPLAYGMKLFDLGGYGKALPVNIAAATNQNLIAYATLVEGKNVFITVINKNYGAEAKDETVRIQLDAAAQVSKAETIFMRGRNDDVSGGSADVTLGGAPIKEDGSWDGNWTSLPASATQGGTITLVMPPASAAVVKITMN